MEVFTRLEDTMRNIFIQDGWQRNLRIGPPSPQESLQFDYLYWAFYFSAGSFGFERLYAS
jgi:hypothetical protein